MLVKMELRSWRDALRRRQTKRSLDDRQGVEILTRIVSSV
jgi:hypothetical protein